MQEQARIYRFTDIRLHVHKILTLQFSVNNCLRSLFYSLIQEISYQADIQEFFSPLWEFHLLLILCQQLILFFFFIQVKQKHIKQHTR